MKVKKMMIDGVVFDGFSKGLKVDNDVLIEDLVRIVNSDFRGANNELDIPRGRVEYEGTKPS